MSADESLARGAVRLPAGARLLAMARDDGLQVFGSTGTEPPQCVADLLLGSGDIGAVVPVAEATTRRIRPAGPAIGWRDAEMAVRRDVTGTWAGAIVVAPGLLRGIRLAATVDDDVEVVDAVVRHVGSLGRRVVEEPSWVTRLPDGRRSAGPGGPPVTSAIDVLVVTAFLDDDVAQTEDRLTFDLIRSVRGQMAAGALTVLLTDGSRSQRQIDALRANGVDVVVPPLDTERWLAERIARFSHAVLTPSALQSFSWERLARTQPQAARILYLSSLPFRQVSALFALTPAAERPSIETVRSAVESRLLETARATDAVWCDADADARWVRGCLPDAEVHVIGSGVEPTSGTPLAERSGVLLLAAGGHDVIMANEDACAAALAQVVRPLRRRDPELTVRVVVDRPSPFLLHEMAAFDAVAVPAGEASRSAATSRLIVDYHTYGTGGEGAIRLALQTRTPFVAHPAAAGRLELGALTGITLFGSAADLVYRCQAHLDDDDRWYRTRNAIDDVVAGHLSPPARASALRDALCSVGIHATTESARWLPSPGPPPPDHPAHHPAAPPLRPEGCERPPALAGDLPDDHDRRYQLWARRYGPTPDVLRALADEIAGLAWRPKISILVPVYNTPPDVLSAAIDSVCDQIYANWQLVLVDDSTYAGAAQEVLRSATGDARVRVVRSEGGTGISAATNLALEASDGDFVAFLDHDDLLKPHALAQVVRWLNADPALDIVYSDEDKLDADGSLVQPHLKPDWSPNLLMSQNYVCHLLVVRRTLVDDVGGLRSEFDGSQDHDLVLRLAERTDRIAHIPEPLYSWRIIAGSASADVDAKPYALVAATRALRAAVERRGHPAEVGDASLRGMYRTRYRLFGQPKVSIIVPTRDGLHLLEPCLRSVYERTTYRNFEVVVVDNQSTDGPTLAYLAALPGRVVSYDHPFNYARLMNHAARLTDCDVFVFLNNDTEVVTPEWIEELLEHAMRREVGAVGGRLYYGDGRVQHEGTVVGLGGWANNIAHNGYWGRGEVVRDVSAVMGACMVMRSSVYWRVGGNDERMRVAYNDVDLCLRVRQAGYQVVYTPHAELYHHEGASRSGREHHEDGPQFGIRWRPDETVDPFYSPLFEPVMPPFRIEL